MVHNFQERMLTVSMEFKDNVLLVKCYFKYPFVKSSRFIAFFPSGLRRISCMEVFSFPWSRSGVSLWISNRVSSITSFSITILFSCRMNRNFGRRVNARYFAYTSSNGSVERTKNPSAFSIFWQ